MDEWCRKRKEVEPLKNISKKVPKPPGGDSVEGKGELCLIIKEIRELKTERMKDREWLKWGIEGIKEEIAEREKEMLERIDNLERWVKESEEEKRKDWRKTGGVEEGIRRIVI